MILSLSPKKNKLGIIFDKEIKKARLFALFLYAFLILLYLRTKYVIALIITQDEDLALTENFLTADS